MPKLLVELEGIIKYSLSINSTEKFKIFDGILSNFIMEISSKFLKLIPESPNFKIL